MVVGMVVGIGGEYTTARRAGGLFFVAPHRESDTMPSHARDVQDRRNGMAYHFRIIRTRDGYVGMVGSECGLCRVYLPEESRAALRDRIRHDHAEATQSDRKSVV